MELLARRSGRSRRLRLRALAGCAAALLLASGCTADVAEDGGVRGGGNAASALPGAGDPARAVTLDGARDNRAPDEATVTRGPAGVSADSEVRDGSTSTPVALFLGTSLTAGLGLNPEDAYPAVLQRMADSAGLPVRVVNAGESGETSANLVRRLSWVLQRSADVVVIETGANDGLRALNVDSTAENIRRVIAAVREELPEAPILLVQMEAPPNLGEAYTSRFRGMYAQVAEESGVTLVPFLLEGVAGERMLNQADGIHPNEEGARLAAGNIWPAFSAALERAQAVAESP